MKISTTQYAKTLLELTENKSQEDVLVVVSKFADLLKTDGQLKNFADIIEKFSYIYNSAHGIVEAEIVTSHKLVDEQLVKLESFIKEKYSAREIVINNIIDEKIMGGIIIKVADEVIDGSISSQLKRLQKELVR